MDHFILRHALKESFPILRLFPHMMNPLGNICECSVDIENDNFLCHKMLLCPWHCEPEASGEAISRFAVFVLCLGIRRHLHLVQVQVLLRRFAPCNDIRLPVI